MKIIKISLIDLNQKRREETKDVPTLKRERIKNNESCKSSYQILFIDIKQEIAHRKRNKHKTEIGTFI